MPFSTERDRRGGPLVRGDMDDITIRSLEREVSELCKRTVALEQLLLVWCDHDWINRADGSTYYTDDWGYQILLTPEQAALMDEVLKDHIDARWKDLS